jgi:hypothetical protein
MKQSPTSAPRLRAYLDEIEGALIMPREDWEALVNEGERLFEIDISATPLAMVLRKAQVVASFAQQLPRSRKRILIFRDDPKDAPFSINLDRYLVFENFRGREDYKQIVANSDTDDDWLMQNFHSDYVIIVPEKETRGHHLRDVPGIYKAKLGSRRGSGLT